MKIGIMQPYFMPYIGYFQLMKAVDKYVVYDDVNYIKGGWVNRNNILINGEKKLFSIALKEASPFKHFNQIFICDDFRKLKKTIQLNYSKSKCFNDVMPLLDDIFNHPDKQLANFIANSFSVILQYLGINTELILSSTIEKNNSLTGQDKVLEICKNLNADTYYNAIGGQELYSKEVFASQGIDLQFLQTNFLPYQQNSKEFIAGLSIIDVLMNNSVEDVNNILDSYTLI